MEKKRKPLQLHVLAYMFKIACGKDGFKYSKKLMTFLLIIKQQDLTTCIFPLTVEYFSD